MKVFILAALFSPLGQFLVGKKYALTANDALYYVEVTNKLTFYRKFNGEFRVVPTPRHSVYRYVRPHREIVLYGQKFYISNQDWYIKFGDLFVNIDPIHDN